MKKLWVRSSLQGVHHIKVLYGMCILILAHFTLQQLWQEPSQSKITTFATQYQLEWQETGLLPHLLMQNKMIYQPPSQRLVIAIVEEILTWFSKDDPTGIRPVNTCYSCSFAELSLPPPSGELDRISWTVRRSDGSNAQQRCNKPQSSSSRCRSISSGFDGRRGGSPLQARMSTSFACLTSL